VPKKTWQKLIGVSRHLKILQREQAKVEARFFLSLSQMFHRMGKEAEKRLLEQKGSINIDKVIGKKWEKELGGILQTHYEQAALVSAAIEWEMHQPRESAKGLFGYVRKGFWSALKGLPGKIINAVIQKVSDIADELEPKKIIDTIKKKVKKVIEDVVGGRARKVPDLPREVEIAQKVKEEVFDKASNASRAKGIAATESQGGMGLGGQMAIEALGELGLVDQKQWRCLHGTGNIDGRVRPAHKEANYQTVSVHDKFWVGGERADYPGDHKLSPGNRCQCRCLAVGISR